MNKTGSALLSVVLLLGTILLAHAVPAAPAEENHTPQIPEVKAAVEATVSDKLDVASPGHRET